MSERIANNTAGILESPLHRHADHPSLGALRAGADRGEALQLVDSLGGVRRDFCVTVVTETRRDIRPASLPLRLEFQATLRSTEVNRQESRRRWPPRRSNSACRQGQ